MGDVVALVTGEVGAYNAFFTLPAGKHVVDLGIDYQIFHITPTRAVIYVAGKEELPPVLVAESEEVRLESFARLEVFIRFLARDAACAQRIREKQGLQYTKSKIEGALQKEALRESQS